MGLDIESGNCLLPRSYVERFAMKTPEELIGMFEEISNSIAHKADYEKLKLRVLKAEEEVQRLTMKQVDLRKKYATANKVKTEKLRLEEEYREKKLKYQSIRLFIVDRQVESLRDKEKK